MPAKDRKLRFKEDECPVKGLRLFNLTGYVPLVNEMFEWLKERNIRVLDVQWWEGKAYAFYQQPHMWMEGAMLCSMDIAFMEHQADDIIARWSESRYCEIK